MAIFSGNKVILFSEETLLEDNVYKKQGDKYFMAIDISDTWKANFLRDPYIKVYEGKNYTQADSEIRISLTNATIVDHRGKEELVVNSKVVKWIKQTLVKKSTNAKFKDLTVYDAAWKHIMDFAKVNNLEVAKYIPLDEFMEKLYANNK